MNCRSPLALLVAIGALIIPAACGCSSSDSQSPPSPNPIPDAHVEESLVPDDALNQEDSDRYDATVDRAPDGNALEGGVTDSDEAPDGDSVDGPGSDTSPPDGDSFDSDPMDSEPMEAAPDRDSPDSDSPDSDPPETGSDGDSPDVHGDAEVDSGLDLGGGVFLFPRVVHPGTDVTIRYQGMYSARDNLTVHYGFNGWNEVPGGPSTMEEDSTGNKNFFAEVPMSPVSSGYETVVHVPLEARAIHLVFNTEEQGSKAWDSNDGQDYGSGLPFPYIGPYLSWNGTTENPSTAMGITFHTGHECLGQVAYGTSASLGSTVADSLPTRKHHISLTGLQPDTHYFYQVSCDVGSSPVHQFRTASDSTNLKFVVAADAQFNGESGRWPEVASEIASNHGDSTLILVGGDMPWNNAPGLWWTFFDSAGSLFASIPMLAAIGNHDTPTTDSNPDSSAFESFFGLDGTEVHRILEVGPARFATLNTERPEDFVKETGPQYTWFRDEVQTTTSATWTFTTMHIPPYDAASRHWSQQGQFRDMTELFDGHVDWVFSGHEHLYQRMKPLRYNASPVSTYGNGPGDGVGYLLLPPSGAWPETALIPHDDPKAYYRDRLAFPLVAADEDTAPSEVGFTIAETSGKTITLTTWEMGTHAESVSPHVVDTITYTKP